MAEEQIRFTQVEDGIASFERKDGSILYYEVNNVPAPYKVGDIIRAIVHGEENIEFIEVDQEAMEARRQRMARRAARIRERVRRTTNQK